MPTWAPPQIDTVLHARRAGLAAMHELVLLQLKFVIALRTAFMLLLNECWALCLPSNECTQPLSNALQLARMRPVHFQARMPISCDIGVLG